MTDVSLSNLPATDIKNADGIVGTSGGSFVNVTVDSLNSAVTSATSAADAAAQAAETITSGGYVKTTDMDTAIGDATSGLVSSGGSGTDLSANPVTLGGKSMPLGSALEQVSSSGPEYMLEPATTATLGGVMVPAGGNLVTDAAGNLKVTGLVVAGSSGTDITSQPVTVGGTVTTVGAVLEKSGAGSPVITISASGTTTLAIPASGDITYLVTPTAAATLQFSGAAATGQSQMIRVIVVGAGFAVTLPTTGVVYPDGTPPTVSTTTGDMTVVDYLAASGASAIVGGV